MRGWSFIFDDRVEGDQEEEAGQAEEDEAREMEQPQLEIDAVAQPGEAELQVFDREQREPEIEDGGRGDKGDRFPDEFDALRDEQDRGRGQGGGRRMGHRRVLGVI